MLCRLLSDPARAAEPADPAAWDAVLRLAAANHLLPALWVGRRDAGRAVELPADVMEAIARRTPARESHPDLVLQRAWQDNRRRCEDLLDQARRIVAVLDAAGIETIALKGWHTLVAGVWGDPAERVMRDLDVLVAGDRADAAVARIRSLGYVPALVESEPRADHQSPALMLPGRQGSVDLHHAVLASPWRTLLPAEAVRAAAAPAPIGADLPTGSRLMSPTHAVVHLVAHAQLQEDSHLAARLPLRAVHELGAMAARWAGGVDWSEVRERFEAAGRGAALDAHLDLARRLFEASVPAPRRPVRAALHRQTCGALLDHPRAAGAYRVAVHLPRTLSRRRMTDLYGPAGGPLWGVRVRARHVWFASRRRLEPQVRHALTRR